jgi:asparagine synthase (glutamine-hydrolysing)
MCGIAGFIGNGNEDTIVNMVKSIRYRGPDNLGFSFIENIGLAQARLSIIDLDSRSNQPFFTEDKDFGIVFNGEIYNYLAIKQDLLKKNKYTFRTTSDTEVLLYAFIEYGKNCLQMIHGMFAFAIYDYRKRELFVARDRMGKKPLYYYNQNNCFVFASEPKALFHHPSVKKELNLETLNQYLTFDYVPSPDSIFKHIYKLEAAHFLIVKNNAIVKNENYWNVNFTENEISFDNAINKLDLLLNDAVKNRLMSDVPLGIFLSGGLDSSAIAYYAQQNSSIKLKTFSIGFNEKSYDESNYARLVANHLGTEHHEQILTSKQSLALIPEIMNKLDEPFADPSIIPTYFLSKFTRESVTVALGGDGSDELMAGYPTFISEEYSKYFKFITPSFASKLSKIANLLPVNDTNISFDFKIKQFLKGLENEKKYMHSYWLGSFTPSLKQKLFRDDIKAEIKNSNGLNSVDYFLNDVTKENHFNQLLYIYYKTYLADDILFKVDRASMYNSLEVRAPFLDTSVVEFLSSLPKKYKIQGNNCKIILKELMRNKLPSSIIDRQKKGFGIPLSKWIKEDMKKEIFSVLNQEDPFFNPSFIKNILDEHISSKQNHRKLIWNLYVFKLWYNQQWNN